MGISRLRNTPRRLNSLNLLHLLAFGVGFGIALGVLLPAPAARAAEVPWLYDVQVPVADQSPRARLESAREGLAQVLTRLTGLTRLPASEVIDRALAAPDLYYNQFGFRRDDENGGLLLQLQFMPDAVLNLIRQANLPVWRSSRPTVLAWVVVDDGGERQILGSVSEHPAVVALKQRAVERGLPLLLPLMDLADQMAVEPAVVWGRLSQPLLEASERYDADILLIGRLQERPDGRWSGSWEFWVDGDVHDRTEQASEPARLGIVAADLVSDEIAARYAVRDSGVRRVELNISAVESAADYADLLRYFSGLEFVDEVDVWTVSGDRIGVSLVTSAEPEQLQELFRMDRRLFPDSLRMSPGPAMELVWQRR
jgi:uncharacterized protein